MKTIPAHPFSVTLTRFFLMIFMAVSLVSCSSDDKETEIDMSDYTNITRKWYATLTKTDNNQTERYDVTLDFLANGTIKSSIDITTLDQGGGASGTITPSDCRYKMNLDKKTLTLYSLDGSDAPITVLSYNVTETRLELTHISGALFPLSEEIFKKVTYTRSK